jgi:hypothetical protein
LSLPAAFNNLRPMTRKLALFIAAVAALQSPAISAARNCAAYQAANPPWTNNGAVQGDEWAWTYLVLDKSGWPTKCLMGANSIDDSDRRFFVCKYMKEKWRPAKDASGRQRSTTVKQFFLIAGPDHEKVLRQARDAYFAKHPDERAQCFADEGPSL